MTRSILKPLPLTARTGVTLLTLLAATALGLFLTGLAIVAALVASGTSPIGSGSVPLLFEIVPGILAAAFLMLHRWLWAGQDAARAGAAAAA